MERDKEICTRDMFKSILLKWRWMIFWMIVFAIILNGINYVKSYKNAEAVKESIADVQLESEEIETTTTSLSDLEAKLSEREISEVKTAVMNYRNYYKSYLNASEYNGNSLRMKLNPNAVINTVLTYCIDSHYEVVYPVIEKSDSTEDIIMTYAKLLNDEKIYDDACVEFELEVESSYLEELVTASMSGESLLVISILGESQEFCEHLANYVKKNMEHFTSEVQKIYGDFDITLASEVCSQQILPALMTEQQTRLTGINNLRSYLANTGANLNDVQKEYYYALLDGIEVEEVETKDISLQNKEETVIIPKVEKFSVKYILLGCIIGIIFVCAYGFIIYLLSNVLHVAEEIRINYDIPILGELNKPTGEKKLFGFVDRFIISLFDKHAICDTENQRYEMICMNVVAATHKAGMKRIFIGGTYNDERVEQVKSDLYRLLQIEIEDIEVGNSILYDAESFKKFAYSDGMILLEKTGRSYFSDIDREIELCQNNQVTVIGMVVL